MVSLDRKGVPVEFSDTVSTLRSRILDLTSFSLPKQFRYKVNGGTSVVFSLLEGEMSRIWY